MVKRAAITLFHKMDARMGSRDNWETRNEDCIQMVSDVLEVYEELSQKKSETIDFHQETLRKFRRDIEFKDRTNNVLISYMNAVKVCTDEISIAVTQMGKLDK